MATAAHPAAARAASAAATTPVGDVRTDAPPPFTLPAAPRWLRGGHAQTIWPALFARAAPHRAHRWQPRWRRERWPTPDGDFIDVDTLRRDADAALPPHAARLVLFHGLEGSSRSHYVRAFADVALRRGFELTVPHFRGCSGEPNHAPRAYHSGDAEEVGWVLARLHAAAPQAPLVAAGVSLGGNALLRWGEREGPAAARHVRALASICAPLDLAACGHAIDCGWNHAFYARMFLRSMKPKALAKLAQHPGLFDAARLRRARTIRAFDDVFTAPLHGFVDAEDYWAQCSAAPHLDALRVPTLVLNARNDPFVPAPSLPVRAPRGGFVTLAQPDDGGHVGFASGRWPGHLAAMPDAVARWLLHHATTTPHTAAASAAAPPRDGTHTPSPVEDDGPAAPRR